MKMIHTLVLVFMSAFCAHGDKMPFGSRDAYISHFEPKVNQITINVFHGNTNSGSTNWQFINIYSYGYERKQSGPLTNIMNLIIAEHAKAATNNDVKTGIFLSSAVAYNFQDYPIEPQLLIADNYFTLSQDSNGVWQLPKSIETSTPLLTANFHLYITNIVSAKIVVQNDNGDVVKTINPIMNPTYLPQQTGETLTVSQDDHLLILPTKLIVSGTNGVVEITSGNPSTTRKYSLTDGSRLYRPLQVSIGTVPRLQVLVSGEENELVIIEKSSDLTVWNTASEVRLSTNGTGNILCGDDMHMFYRAMYSP